MANYWINWRFGTRHLIIGPDQFSFDINPYWVKHKPSKWFERYPR